LIPIISCLIPNTLTPDSLIEYRACIEHQKIIEHVIYWRPIVEEYFDTDDVAKALTVIYCESSGYSSARNENTNLTRDIGLWQFNDNTWAWLEKKLKFNGSRFNPKLSTRIASWLIYNDGWHHWNSSKHCWGKYEY
jgi:hypothetical protein